MRVDEICEYLAFRVSSDYKLVRFSVATFNEVRNELSLTFLYDESIKSKISELKARLEKEYKDQIKLDIKYLFEYKSSYMDAERLGLLLRGFLTNNFSMMTLDLGEDDVCVTGAFNVELHLPKHTASYVRASKAYEKFVQELRENYFYNFNFSIIEKPTNDTESIEDIEKYVSENIKNVVRVDKVCKVKNVEYYLGKVIKERPIKIEHLRITPDEQVIAGTMSFLTRREYTRDEEKRPYYTFVLDDGNKKQNCVFFPNTKTLAPFEKLVDGTTICVVGVNDERKGRVNFSVKGVSFCELTSAS